MSLVATACTTRCTIGVLYFISADEDDLQGIATDLSDITDVVSLGLNLGLRMSTLKKIMADYPQLERQKTEVIYYWLKRREIVRNKQNEHPTWDGLALAVARLDPSLSDRIRYRLT